jgi:hypothetical protein
MTIRHFFLEEKETVAMVDNGSPVVPKDRMPEDRSVVSPPDARRWWREERRIVVASKVLREDAREDSPGKGVGEQKIVGVDGVAPGAADAPRLRERPATESAEDVKEQVVG